MKERVTGDADTLVSQPAAIGTGDSTGEDSTILPGDGATPTRVTVRPPAAAAGPDLPPALQANAVFDHFIVLGKLGAGGMGVVLAAYDPDLDRKVALKVLKPSAGATKSLHARLMREAQALAKLSHPNVVSVFEVGLAEDDMFIAMEYVDGQTLTAWLAERTRSWREIVDLFRKIGAGLRAAHAQSLVHRDFKPDNVLVGADGRPRICDFGLVGAMEVGVAETQQAEAADQDLGAEWAALTRAGAVMGTPSYMAPEQHRGEVVNARADQYAFCVSLYEALYGQRPFGGRTYEQIRASVLDDPPKAPPAQTDVPRWVHAIVARGMAKNPADRFDSMDALLEALAHDPATTRRRRLTAIAAVAIVAIGAFGLTRTSSKPALCTGLDQKLAGVWDDAARQRVRVAFEATERSYAFDTFRRTAAALDAYAQRLTTMRTQACQATHLIGDQSAELLDLRAQCLNRRASELGALVGLFAQGPDTKVLDKAIDAASSLPGLEACADVEGLRSPVPLPADEPTRARVLALQSELAKADANRYAGRPVESIELGRAVLTQAERVGYANLIAEAAYLVGRQLDQRGNSAEALRLLRKAAEAAAAARRDDLVARAWLDMLITFGEQGQHDRALSLRHFASAAITRAGDAPRLRAMLHSYAGMALRRAGKHKAAVAELERSLAIYEHHPSLTELADYSTVLANVAAGLASADRLKEAVVYARKVATLREQQLGAGHPLYADALSNLADISRQLGDYASARRNGERAVAIVEKAIGPDALELSLYLDALGQVARAQARLADAHQIYSRQKKIIERSLGKSHPRLRRSLVGLAEVAEARRDREAAARLYRQAIALSIANNQERTSFTAGIYNGLAQVLRDQKRYDEAIATATKALDIANATDGPTSNQAATVTSGLATIYQLAGKLAEATRWYGKAIALRDQLLGADHPRTAITRYNYATLLEQQNRCADAIPQLEVVQRVWRKAYRRDHPRLIYVAAGLGECLRKEKRLADALHALEPMASFDSEAAADVRFVLAKVLWDSKQQLARAATLARSARDTYARTKQTDLAKQVTAWMRARNVR